MAIEISKTPLQAALDRASAIADKGVSSIIDYNLRKDLLKEQAEQDLETYSQKQILSLNMEAIKNAGPTSYVYGKNGEIDIAASSKKANEKLRYVEKGKNNVLNPTGYWTNAEKLTGEGYDPTRELYSKDDLTQDDAGIFKITNPEEGYTPEPWEFEGLLAYGIIDLNDMDGIAQGDDAEQAYGQFIADYQGSEGPAIREEIARRWSYIKEGIYQSSWYKDPNKVEEFRVAKLKGANEQIDLLVKNNGALQNALAKVNTFKENFAKGQLGLVKIFSDDGKVRKYYDVKNPSKLLKASKFEDEYQETFKIYSSSDPVQTFLERRNRFATEEQRQEYDLLLLEENPQLYRELVGSAKNAEILNNYYMQVDNIKRSANIGSRFTIKDRQVSESLDSIQDFDAEKVAEANNSSYLDLGIPMRYASIMEPGLDEAAALIDYKSKMIDVHFNPRTNGNYLEALFYAEKIGEYSETDESPEVSWDEISSTLPENILEAYNTYKESLGDEDKKEIIDNFVPTSDLTGQKSQDGRDALVNIILKGNDFGNKRDILLPELKNWYDRYVNVIADMRLAFSQDNNLVNLDLQSGVAESVFQKNYPELVSEYQDLLNEQNALMSDFYQTRIDDINVDKTTGYLQNILRSTLPTSSSQDRISDISSKLEPIDGYYGMPNEIANSYKNNRKTTVIDLLRSYGNTEITNELMLFSSGKIFNIDLFRLNKKATKVEATDKVEAIGPGSSILDIFSR